MHIAAMLIGMALLALVALGLSLFIPVVDGGSLFDRVWPYLVGVIVGLISVAAALASHARRNPEAWIHRSLWPRLIVVFIVSAIALFFAGGVLV